MRLEDNITVIKGVGEHVADAFSRLNIYTVEDLLKHVPGSFDLYEKAVTIDDSHIGSKIAVVGEVLRGSHFTLRKGGLTLNKCKLRCGDKSLTLSFFNTPYIKKSLVEGNSYVVRGILINDRYGLHMNQPEVHTLAKYEALVGRLIPVYRTAKGISSNAIAKYAGIALDSCQLQEDFLSERELNELKLTDYKTAINYLHRPANLEEYIAGHNRLVFQEFFNYILPIKRDRAEYKYPFPNPMIEVAETGRLIESLPYTLTNAQLRTWQDIERDLTRDVCMNRLVQGDVGSGKTIIAFLALLMNAANGHQGCLMAPTEVLARQHYESIGMLVKAYPDLIRPVLLIGSLSQKEKKQVQAAIAEGSYNIIIGTNALIQAKAEYKDLTLVITDEQHRFGVKQRETLATKGQSCHVLVMSATPIPRTLAMIMYGDLSVSIIDELPSNRLPIKNAVVDYRYRNKAYEFIQKEVTAGHQAYVICPKVDAGENDEIQNVIEYCDSLKEALPDSFSVAYIHGRMKANDKAEIMNRYLNRDIDVLVSTTVIEVGVNVPNATVMMVENADRFGLSTLHQLRGRVGRGDAQSYCIFISGKKDGPSRERLEILSQTNDGFKIADEDMKLRGPGDIFGIAQSGDFDFRYADIYNDSEVLKRCSAFVDYLLSNQGLNRYREIEPILYKYEVHKVDFRTI